MSKRICRGCLGRSGELVLDLGEQPAADHFPLLDDPGPDPVYPLQMWLCASCGLAQLTNDATVPDEPRGTEPSVLAMQAADAVARVSAAGLLPHGGRIAEYRSPHGESWAMALAPYGLSSVGEQESADVVLDCFGLMHVADQAGALAERVARVAPGGVLLLQYHSLDAIIRQGQWNILRSGHYAYHSTSTLVQLLAGIRFRALTAWRFDLYGGTVLLAASRMDERGQSDRSVEMLLRQDDDVGVRSANVLRRLQHQAEDHATRLHQWLEAQRAAGKPVIGYGAASRAVALLVRSGVDRTLLSAVVDASVAKQGRRMPGTDIPIVPPSQLAERHPASVLLFVPDLLPEVRASYGEVEASGAQWVDAMALAA